jgi:hypothetical protein
MPTRAAKRSAHAIAAAQYVAHERLGALAMAAYHLDQILAHLRAAQHYNLTHELRLNLPSEADIAELIGECVKMQRRETAG